MLKSLCMAMWSSCLMKVCAFCMVNVTSRPTPDAYVAAAGLLKAFQAVFDIPIKHCATLNVCILGDVYLRSNLSREH